MANILNRIKQIIDRFKDLTQFGVTNIVASTISGLFWFYIASLVRVEHYGEISYYIALAGIASVISSLGASNVITVYTAKGEKILQEISLLSIISALCASIVLFFIYYNLGASLYVFGIVIFGLVTAEMLGRKLYKGYSKYIITQKLFMVGLSLLFYYLVGYYGILLGIGLSFFPYSIRLLYIFKKSKIDFSVLKSKRSFMVNSYVLDISRMFSGSTDKLIIGPLFGFTLLGNYQLGIQFLSLLILLPNIVYLYILPQDASGAPHKKLKKVTVLISIGLAILGILLAPLVVPILFPKFLKAIEVIQIVSIAIIPISINFTYVSKFLGIEKSKIVLIGSGIYLLVLVSGIFILSGLYGINGAAIALVLAASSEAIFLVGIEQLNQKK